MGIPTFEHAQCEFWSWNAAYDYHRRHCLRSLLKGIQADDQKSVIFCETVVQVILDRIPTKISSKELQDLMSKFDELSLNAKTWDAWVSINFNLSYDFEKNERDDDFVAGSIEQRTTTTFKKEEPISQ